MKIRNKSLKTTATCFSVMLGIGIGLSIPTNIALAQTPSGLPQLTAQWWQWAFSIPTAQNPIVDQTGGSCMIGQRGSIWFLAGNFGGTTMRTCSIPEGTTLFFPVINQVGYNSPNCGQGPENLSVKTMREQVANFIGTVRLADLSVELDSKPINHFDHVQSDVFAIALPDNNVGGCPAGVYSPAVDEGYYVTLYPPLAVGPHTLHIRSTVPSFSFDVTYNLAIVKVLNK
jgi:hypothetical protein